ncbi:PREDICTED: ATP-dependent DNA helicase Q1-like [Amphimedon queenslandica]|uniref:Helicase ATP-binding domain-containing protein n=1 Tax=Amphimedon queenslandica TaxID=400682 RepID=A0AAN0K530_AMPQE|nr:PREDICTED: ATP-dependent DNA helicase Q1-like [Amphimedon queenslandica]|eukprot:XP_019864452.1 PREDICTED: ATP-dependent DNA helicase Q1-like [Amphimedon queenslandica]
MAAAIAEKVDAVVVKLGFQLHDKQKEAILSYISGKDTFDSIRGLPPGTSIALVVCPLIALMKDQTERFRQLGIAAAYVWEPQISLERFATGEFQLIFISPECLNKGRIWRSVLKSDLYQERLVAFIVDEVHLIKNWGEEYRPEFSKLGEVRSLLPKNTQVMALTATATSHLREHVMKIMSMKDVALVEVSPSKDNLSIEELFLPIMNELKNKRLGMERIIILCCRPIDCATLWRAFFCYLKDQMTEPPGHPLRKSYVLLTITRDVHKSLYEMASLGNFQSNPV